MTKIKKKLIVTKLKKSNCDTTQKLRYWPNATTQIVTKLKRKKIKKKVQTEIVTKLKKNFFWKNYKKKKKKLWQNSKPLNVKVVIVREVTVAVVTVAVVTLVIVTSFSKNPHTGDTESLDHCG